MQGRFTGRMAAIASNFDFIGTSIFAELTAIFVAGADLALARWMSTFLTCFWHKEFLSGEVVGIGLLASSAIRHPL